MDASSTVCGLPILSGRRARKKDFASLDPAGKPRFPRLGDLSPRGLGWLRDGSGTGAGFSAGSVGVGLRTPTISDIREPDGWGSFLTPTFAGYLHSACWWNSALHPRADYLLTRNVGDFPAAILPILAPDEFLALLDRAADAS
jgi:hypothetical protein